MKQAEPRKPGPYLDLRFDATDSANPVIDRSPNPLPVIVHGAPELADGAIALDGVDDFLEVTAASGFDEVGRQLGYGFSVEVKLRTEIGWRAALPLVTIANDGKATILAIDLRSDSAPENRPDIRMYLRDEDRTQSVPHVRAAPLFDGQWHHLVFTYDGADAGGPDAFAIYLDGVAQPVEGTEPVNGTDQLDDFAPFQHALRIGASGRAEVGKERLKAEIATFVFHDRPLSPEDVAERFSEAGIDAGSGERAAVMPIDWSRFSKGKPQDGVSLLIEKILANCNQYGVTRWWERRRFAGQSGQDYLDFGGTKEHDIRPVAMEAFALAVGLKLKVYDQFASEVLDDQAEAMTVRLIRSLARRHFSNEAGGWGADWQSALWASSAGTAAWLMWDELQPADQQEIQRMIEFEANRFLGYRVPYFRDAEGNVVSKGDTRADDNAWNAAVLHLAAVMVPGHSNQPRWLEKGNELAISVFARPQDVGSGELVDGKPLSEWLRGSNSNEDSTVINHGRIHPDYMVAGLFEYPPSMVFALADTESPEAATFNLESTYRALYEKDFAPGITPYETGGPLREPGGTIYRPETAEIYYPQGNDWGTQRKMNFALADVVAEVFAQEQTVRQRANRWAGLHAQAVMDMQARFDNGRTYEDAIEDKYPSREEWVAHLAARTYLLRWLAYQGAFGTAE